MENNKGFCRYCGNIANGGSQICCNCVEKLQLVRTIQDMLRPTYKKKKAKEKRWR